MAAALRYAEVPEGEDVTERQDMEESVEVLRIYAETLYADVTAHNRVAGRLVGIETPTHLMCLWRF